MVGSEIDTQAQHQDSKHIVQAGYDQIAHAYMQWTADKDTPRLQFLDKLLSSLRHPSDARVLDLGCGAGLPSTKILAQKCGQVVANDSSAAQIALARANLPEFTNVQFLHEDMTKLDFEPGALEAAVAFYSIIHLPRSEQLQLFKRLWTWLSSGGYLLCNLGVHDDPGRVRNWLGTPMYWSTFDADVNLHQLAAVGFTIVERAVLWDDEDGRSVPFLWVLATKA